MIDKHNKPADDAELSCFRRIAGFLPVINIINYIRSLQPG